MLFLETLTKFHSLSGVSIIDFEHILGPVVKVCGFYLKGTECIEFSKFRSITQPRLN